MLACDISPPKFLSSPRPHIALASYPRSGNSLTRSVLEGLTNTWTGSDFCRNDTAGREGLAGWSDAETVHDDRVWLVKTHSRFEIADQGGAFAQFDAQRAILLVRHRRRKPPKHTAPSVPGPAGMACGASFSTAAKSPDKMLQHPFQALACVRQAARARHIDISSWDLAPGA